MAKILVLIIIVAAIVRFWGLGSSHLGFFRDEAALGFNTYSIIQTSSDEYGQRFPIFFRSFEVFFLPAYVYLSVPFVFLFSLSEFSTRFLSALSGTLIVFSAFLIAQQLFSSKRISILVSLLVAFSPWSIFYSRGAFEGNLALAAFSFGIIFWLKFLETNKKKFFYISLVIFILSMYSYQAPRLVVPLFIFFSILCQKNWWQQRKLWFFGLLLGAVLYSPILFLTFTAAGQHRAVGVSVFSGAKGNTPSGLPLPLEISSLYLQYFSPYNLFWENDYNTQRIVNGFSTFYFWELPFLLIGLWSLLYRKVKYMKELLIWLLVAPIPAALTRDPFHTYRALLIFLPLTLIIGLGVEELFKWIPKYSKVMLSAFLIVLGFSVFNYLFGLFYMTPVTNWKDWDYGYREIADVIKKEPQDLKVVIDNPNTESYIELLFYKVITINDYQNTAWQLIGNGNYYSLATEMRPNKVGRFEFRSVDWPTERGNSDTLFIFSADRLYPSEFAGDPKLKLEKTIMSPSNDPAFYIIRVL